MTDPALSLALTDEQQRIVAHDLGPALVFAVAGSGKTTSMEHRIERLIREGIFPASKILATTFSRRAAGEFEGRLKGKRAHCKPVRVHTLHSIGFGILRLAQQRGFLDNLQLSEGNSDTGGLDRQILYGALERARSERVPFADELETLDQDDFLNYVSLCKGNLRYADLAAARLPRPGLKVATQAEPPESLTTLEWYLELYRLYERVRREGNWITYDDMLMSGWELLLRQPALLQEIQGKFQCVIVDEFQDVNLAQSEILDFMTQPHRNYMAIGDEDQTIYEWRGASPDFILNFTERYDAKEYFIRDNFRCKASQVALANEVIRHNRKRREKFLSLTQGFEGDTTLHHAESDEAMGAEIVREIEAAFKDGVTPDDVVVLVRIYAQTAYIEANLIGKGIPYKIVGGRPFYDRGEVRTVLGYLRLAQLERGLQAGQPLTTSQIREFTDLWMSLYNRPKRYLRRSVAEQIAKEVTFHDRPLSKVLAVSSGMAERGTASKLAELAETLSWLAKGLEATPANELLTELVSRLDYVAYLKDTSGFEATAREKIANVYALLHYAEHKGTAAAFLTHLDQLKTLQVHDEAEKGLVTLMTMFRAKGLEWPVVFVPGCNDKLIPFGEADRIEEERRLFYVAITRAKERLHLYTVKSRPISPFLQEARYDRLMQAIGVVRAALGRTAVEWRTRDALSVAHGQRTLRLKRYFHQWWHQREEPEQVYAVAQSIQRLYSAAAGRELTTRLGLKSWDREVWELFGPLEREPDETDYPDLEQFVRKTEAGRGSGASKNGEEAFQRGERVQHSTFGSGVIERVAEESGGTKLTVRFDDPKVGKKQLLQQFAKVTRLETE